MLNAFRHHWEEHRRARRWGGSQRGGAQRLSASLGGAPPRRSPQEPLGVAVLNAFRHHWEGHPWLRRWGRGGCRAQRLSASLGGARPLAGHGFAGEVEVLNAFRHHWEGHDRSRATRLPGNYRAQRLSASLGGALGPDGRQDPAALVLNAFRHHWEGHSARVAGVAAAVVCSTPFGITGRGTLPGPAGEAPCPWCAQRLSASLGGAQAAGWGGSIVAVVLNAFRHHWEGHSTWRARSSTALRCSTPFGITGRGTD